MNSMKKKEVTGISIGQAIDRLYEQHCFLNNNSYRLHHLMSRDAFTAHVIVVITQGYNVY